MVDVAESKYAGLKIINEEEGFVFNTVHVEGLTPGKWALVPIAAAKSLVRDFPEHLEMIDQEWIDAAIAEDTIYPGRVYTWDEPKECLEETNQTQKDVDISQKDPSSPDFGKFEGAKDELKKDKEEESKDKEEESKDEPKEEEESKADEPVEDSEDETVDEPVVDDTEEPVEDEIAEDESVEDALVNQIAPDESKPRRKPGRPPKRK